MVGKIKQKKELLALLLEADDTKMRKRGGDMSYLASVSKVKPEPETTCDVTQEM